MELLIRRAQQHRASVGGCGGPERRVAPIFPPQRSRAVQCQTPRQVRGAGDPAAQGQYYQTPRQVHGGDSAAGGGPWQPPSLTPRPSSLPELDDSAARRCASGIGTPATATTTPAPRSQGKVSKASTPTPTQPSPANLQCVETVLQ